MLTGLNLIEEIDATTPETDSFCFWWLGQQSYIIKSRTATIYIDPFLSDMPGRLIKPLLKPEEVTNADIICGTHDHIDHIDRSSWPSMAKASANAVFVVPDLLKKSVSEGTGIGAERIVGLDDSTSCTICGVKLTGIASAHEFLDRDSATGKYPYLGYVVQTDRRAIYHAGDCCIYEGIHDKLRRWKLDVMFLPINGRDATRLAAGCIGNMTYQEAADLAGSVSALMVVPGHHDMFAGNLGDVPAFTRYMQIKYPGIRTLACEYGKRYALPS